MLRQRSMRSRAVTFLLQGLHDGAGPRSRRPPRRVALSLTVFTLRLLNGLGRCLPFRWHLQLHAGASGFREPDCNRLFGGSRTMLAFSHVMYLFPHKLPCLRARRLSLAGIFTGALNCFFFRHIRTSRLQIITAGGPGVSTIFCSRDWTGAVGGPDPAEFFW